MKTSANILLGRGFEPTFKRKDCIGKVIFVAMALSVLVVVSSSAQGFVWFKDFTQPISTNLLIGGAASGYAGTGPNSYYYALYFSTNASSVNGQTAAFAGLGQNRGYYFAFNDSHWKLVAYGTNYQVPGWILGANTNGGYTTIPGVPAGTSASVRFVVIGWSATIGSTITDVNDWVNNNWGDGWIGQSMVSGPLLVGGPAPVLPVQIFGSNYPQIQGFLLGRVGIPDPPPYIYVEPSSIAVEIGATATFSAMAWADTWETLSAQWQLNGTNIYTSGHYNLTATNYINYITFPPVEMGAFTLTIPNAQAADAGEYSVIISNSIGYDTSTNAVLTVLIPPLLQTELSGQTMLISWPGSTASYAVQSSDNPAGPWSDSGLNIFPDGTNLTVSVQATNQMKFFRLIYQ